MTIHPTDETIHDYADGTLAAAAREGVARHVALCPHCAGRTERLRDLLARAATAPRVVEPADDLWPAIRARIARPAPVAADETDRHDRAPGARSRWRKVPALFAASIAIAVASSLLTLRFDREPERPIDQSVARTAAPAVTEPSAGLAVSADAHEAAADVAVAVQYARAAQELAETWRRTKAPLTPATAAALDSSLRALDQAITESRAALSRAPDDPILAEILAAAYRRKVDLLRRALALPAYT